VHKRNSTVEFITYEDYYDDNYDAWEVTGRPVTEFKNMYKDMLYAWETYEVPSMERELYVFIIIDVILIVVLGITLIVSRRDEGASM